LNKVVVGVFGKEDQGIGIASDVVKVDGEEFSIIEPPATPGSMTGNTARWYVGDLFRVFEFLGTTLRKPQNHNDSLILF